jgi:8-oxo-dGTP pyrophosphatase MutT (NUDIX family)
MRKNEEELHQLLMSFSKKLPHFSDGRIDYSQSDIAPVITVFIACQNEFLLLKRSNAVRTYKEKWNTVAGYLDNPKQNIFEKMLEELKEELNITRRNISSYSYGKSYQFTDKDNNKTWIVHPSLVMLSQKPVIKLNWEHSTFKWITIDEIDDYDTVPNLKESMERAFSLDL